jgi:hypothetical protein
LVGRASGRNQAKNFRGSVFNSAHTKYCFYGSATMLTRKPFIEKSRHTAGYDNLWRYCLRKAFPKTKEATFRKDVSKRLHPILKLRNRVAHYEPILKYDLAKYNQNIIDIINWIEPEFVSYLKKL